MEGCRRLRWRQVGTPPALLGRPHVILDLCLEEGGEKDGRTLQAEAAVLLRLSQRVIRGRHLQSTNMSSTFLPVMNSVVDPDPHGSASNGKVGSGSGNASTCYAGSGSAS